MAATGQLGSDGKWREAVVRLQAYWRGYVARQAFAQALLRRERDRLRDRSLRLRPKAGTGVRSGVPSHGIGSGEGLPPPKSAGEEDFEDVPVLKVVRRAPVVNVRRSDGARFSRISVSSQEGFSLRDSLEMGLSSAVGQSTDSVNSTPYVTSHSRGLTLDSRYEGATDSPVHSDAEDSLQELHSVDEANEVQESDEDSLGDAPVRTVAAVSQSPRRMLAPRVGGSNTPNRPPPPLSIGMQSSSDANVVRDSLEFQKATAPREEHKKAVEAKSVLQNIAHGIRDSLENHWIGPIDEEPELPSTSDWKSPHYSLGVEPSAPQQQIQIPTSTNSNSSHSSIPRRAMKTRNSPLSPPLNNPLVMIPKPIASVAPSVKHVAPGLSTLRRQYEESVAPTFSNPAPSVHQQTPRKSQETEVDTASQGQQFPMASNRDSNPHSVYQPAQYSQKQGRAIEVQKEPVELQWNVNLSPSRSKALPLPQKSPTRVLEDERSVGSYAKAGPRIPNHRRGLPPVVARGVPLAAPAPISGANQMQRAVPVAASVELERQLINEIAALDRPRQVPPPASGQLHQSVELERRLLEELEALDRRRDHLVSKPVPPITENIAGKPVAKPAAKPTSQLYAKAPAPSKIIAGARAEAAGGAKLRQREVDPEKDRVKKAFGWGARDFKPRLAQQPPRRIAPVKDAPRSKPMRECLSEVDKEWSDAVARDALANAPHDNNIPLLPALRGAVEVREGGVLRSPRGDLIPVPNPRAQKIAAQFIGGMGGGYAKEYQRRAHGAGGRVRGGNRAGGDDSSVASSAYPVSIGCRSESSPGSVRCHKDIESQSLPPLLPARQRTAPSHPRLF